MTGGEGGWCIAEYVATGVEVVVVSINHGPPLPTPIKTIAPFL